MTRAGAAATVCMLRDSSQHWLTGPRSAHNTHYTHNTSQVCCCHFMGQPLSCSHPCLSVNLTIVCPLLSTLSIPHSLSPLSTLSVLLSHPCLSPLTPVCLPLLPLSVNHSHPVHPSLSPLPTLSVLLSHPCLSPLTPVCPPLLPLSVNHSHHVRPPLSPLSVPHPISTPFVPHSNPCLSPIFTPVYFTTIACLSPTQTPVCPPHSLLSNDRDSSQWSSPPFKLHRKVY